MNPTVLTSTIHKHSLSQTHVMIKVIIITNIYQKWNICSCLLVSITKKNKKTSDWYEGPYDWRMVLSTIGKTAPFNCWKRFSKYNNFNLGMNYFNHWRERSKFSNICGLQWMSLFKIITKRIGTNNWRYILLIVMSMIF